MSIREALLVFADAMIIFLGKQKGYSLIALRLNVRADPTFQFLQSGESMMLKTTNYDVVILGSGPAGLQAAVHAARKKVAVLLMGKETKSSLFHAHIENFCCLFNVKGEDLLNVGRQQAINFGAELLEEDVLQVLPAGTIFKIVTESGQALESKSLIIATGTTRNRLGVAGEKELLGRGVSYCVECDANFYKDEDVAVVGGASAAVSGALTLLNYAAEVHLICDKLDVTDALKKQLQDSAIVIHEGHQVKQIVGENKVVGVVLKDGSNIPVNGVFIELGAKGLMELATHLGVRLDDEMKYIQTNKNMETNVPGVFAAGDICGPPWQMAKAVGEGCVAGIGAANYARKMKSA
jgi:thioredoxin reductase (NADPH)